MQTYTLTSSLPVYLPYDMAVVPFGDPFNDVTITSSTTGIITVPGYVPNVNDAVGFTATSGNTVASGITPYAGINVAATSFTGVAAGLYYVKAVTAATGAFSIAATKGGAAIATTTSNSASGQVVIHLLSLQVDGTKCPFKSGGSVVVQNQTTTDATLQGAADANELAPGSVYPSGKNPPGGPGVYTQIVSVPSGKSVLAVLGADWILASGSSLVLLQN